MGSIQINSLVQLKSGGPLMTVESFARKREEGNPLTAMQIADESQVNCEWFEGLALLHGTFDEATVTLISTTDQTKTPGPEAVTLAYTGHIGL